MEKIIIYSDGASKGNPGPGGWGAVVASSARVEELGGHEAHTTNNRMEMTAALEALVHAARVSQASAAHVIVHTDSSYVINGITRWVHGWKMRGWQTSQKKEVLNQDLWQRLDEAVSALGKVEWQYVGGHIGIPGNERVDEIASDSALGKKVSLYAGARSAYPIDLEHRAHEVEKQNTRSASRARSKQKAYSYVSVASGVVAVDKTWSACEARVKGKRARFKKATSPEEEREIIKTFSSR